MIWCFFLRATQQHSSNRHIQARLKQSIVARAGLGRLSGRSMNLGLICRVWWGEEGSRKEAGLIKGTWHLKPVFKKVLQTLIINGFLNHALKLCFLNLLYYVSRIFFALKLCFLNLFIMFYVFLHLNDVCFYCFIMLYVFVCT